MIRVFAVNENNKIELTEEELDKILLDSFNEGKIIGKQEGKLEERLEHLDNKIKELEKKNNYTTINPTPIITPNYPTPNTPHITWDWSKVTCDDFQTTVDSSKDTLVAHSYTPSEFNINNSKKEKKKNGR